MPEERMLEEGAPEDPVVVEDKGNKQRSKYEKKNHSM